MSPRTLFRRWSWVLLLVSVSVFMPQVATADPLEVSLVEHENGIDVRVSGFTSDVQEPDHVIHGPSGSLLFLPGHEAKIERIYPQTKSHRLQFVQVGRRKDQVAVKLRQRDGINGPMSPFIDLEREDNTLVIRVRDTAQPIAAVAPTVKPTDTADDAQERASTLAALEASLGETTPSEAVGPPKVEVLTTPPDTLTEAPAVAADLATQRFDAPPEVPNSVDEPDGWSASTSTPRTELGRWFAVMGGCVFVLGGVIWIRRKRGISGDEPLLKILSRVAVGPRQQILWIRAGTRELLVGSTEHGISLLSEVGRASDLASVGVETTPTARTTRTGTQEVPQMNVAAEHRVAEFKAKLRTALGRELTTHRTEPEVPDHIRTLEREPAWTHRENIA